jgi:hypothetical protein
MGAMTPRRLALFAAVLALTQAPGSLRAADIDPLVPPDTESYLSINVKSALESPLFQKQLLGPLKDALGDVPEIKTISGDLGFDPLKDVHRVLVAMPGGTDTDRGLIIAHGTFDQAKFEKRAGDAARDNEDAFKIHKVKLGADATATVWEVVVPGQDTSIYVALVNNKVLVASPGKDYVIDALKQHRARKKATLKNKEFQSLVENLDARQTVSFASLGKSLAAAVGDSLPAGVTDSLKQIEAIGGGLTITNEVKLDVLVASNNGTSADSVRTTLDKGVKLSMVGLALLTEGRKELEVLLEVVKTVKVGGKGKVVVVSARLTADVLKDFFEKDE